MKSLVEQLIEKRKSLKWSQRKLAEVSGIAQAQIARIESGAVDPRLSTLETLGLAMGVEPSTRPALPPILQDEAIAANVAAKLASIATPSAAAPLISGLTASLISNAHESP